MKPRPFILPDGSTSVRYYYDKDGILRDGFPGQESFPCPIYSCVFVTKHDASIHVASWHRPGGPYFGYGFTKRIFESESPAGKPTGPFAKMLQELM